MLIYKELRDRVTSGDRVLDVGTKDGRHLTGVDGRVIAVDLEPKATLSEVQYITADGFALPFKNNAFDFIVCNQVLEHVDDKNSLLKEIGRVLKSDGLFLVSFPNRLFPFDPHGYPPGFPLLPRSIALIISKLLSHEQFEYYRDHAYYLSSFSGRRVLSHQFRQVEYATIDLLNTYPETFKTSKTGILLLKLRPIINIITNIHLAEWLFEATFGYAAYRCRLPR